MNARFRVAALAAFTHVAVAGAALAQVPAPPAQDAFALRAGAWDRSVQLEEEGKLLEARALLMQAWGPGDSYEVTVRIAWLSLRMGQYGHAAVAYRTARTLPGAGPEATQGLSSALTGLGYGKLEDSSNDEARLQFKEALALDPAKERAKAGLAQIDAMPTIEPELWMAYVRMPDYGPTWNGWAAFAQLPWHVTGALTLRAAYRHVDLQREVPSVPPVPGMGYHGGGSGLTTQTWRQNEVYAAADFDKPWWAVGLLGIGLLPSDADPAWGAAMRGRIGRTFGLNVDGSAIRMESGWNRQLLPTVFLWPTRYLGLAAGSRITGDPQGTMASFHAGATLKTHGFAMHVSGHAGPERWPVSMMVPSVLTVGQELPYGVNVTAVVSVSSLVRLGLQTQFERVSIGGAEKNYFTVSGGVQLAPSF
jgi:hypothetical protein